MSQGNRPAARVHFRMVQPQHVQAIDGHGGKGLVDLDDVDVVFCQVEFREELGHGERGADAHDARRYARDGRAAEFREDGLRHFLGFGALH